MKMREIRFLAKAEVRAKADGSRVITGYAAMFNSLSSDLGGFKEVIRPGAFTQSLADGADVRCLFNHDENMILGRTSAGTLRLAQDEVGLRFECELGNQSYATDLYESIQRGDIDQCSFGFYCQDDNWIPTSEDPGVLREVTRADVFDVSPVTFPAYQSTSLAARSLFPDGTDEIEQRKAQVAETLKQVADKRAAAKTKKVAGVDLPASSFAYVGDESDTSTWKLPIHFPGDDTKTVNHIKDAIGRFPQTKGIPNSEKSAVWHKIVGAAKAHGIKVNEEKSVPDFVETRTDSDASYEEIQNLVNAALPKTMYVCATYDDYVIACDWSGAANGYMKIPYTVNDDDSVELGEAQAVVIDFVPSERAASAISELRTAAAAGASTAPVEARSEEKPVDPAPVVEPVVEAPAAVEPEATQTEKVETPEEEAERQLLAMRARAAVEMA
jgi:HK97 family phage prohead protease